MKLHSNRYSTLAMILNCAVFNIATAQTESYPYSLSSTFPYFSSLQQIVNLNSDVSERMKTVPKDMNLIIVERNWASEQLDHVQQQIDYSSKVSGAKEKLESLVSDYQQLKQAMNGLSKTDVSKTNDFLKGKLKIFMSNLDEIRQLIEGELYSQRKPLKDLYNSMLGSGIAVPSEKEGWAYPTITKEQVQKDI